MSGEVSPSNDFRCSSIARLLGAHTDGQLDAAKTLEVDDHLGVCEDCRERVALDRAIRGSLKKAVQTSTPDDVRTRMLAAMAGAQAFDAKPAEAVESKPPRCKRRPRLKKKRPAMLRHWRTSLPIASAAAIALRVEELRQPPAGWRSSELERQRASGLQQRRAREAASSTSTRTRFGPRRRTRMRSATSSARSAFRSAFRGLQRMPAASSAAACFRFRAASAPRCSSTKCSAPTATSSA